MYINKESDIRHENLLVMLPRGQELRDKTLNCNEDVEGPFWRS